MSVWPYCVLCERGARMNTKIYDIDEARALLPRVASIVHDLQMSRHQLDQPAFDANPSDAVLLGWFHQAMDKLDALGFHLEDLSKGTVGCYHVHEQTAWRIIWDPAVLRKIQYADLAVNARVFTVDQANAELERIRKKLDIISTYRQIAEECRGELKIHTMMSDVTGWNETIATPDYCKLQEIIQHNQLEAENLRMELLQQGFQVTDSEYGTVDFYHVRDGRLVFLCWQPDEPDVRRWHSLHSGYEGKEACCGGLECEEFGRT